MVYLCVSRASLALLFSALFVCQVASIQEKHAIVDMHTHSSLSDGEDSPKELMEKAAEASVSIISLTDHDLIHNPPMGKKYAQKNGIEFINGVEISCEWQYAFPSIHGQRLGKVHLLGYFVDPSNHDLQEALTRIQESRTNRNNVILGKLKERGIDISMEEVSALVGKDEGIGRPHFAKVLVNKGVVQNLQEAFDKYLSNESLNLDQWSISINEVRLKKDIF